jgi:hypothetical protein
MRGLWSVNSQRHSQDELLPILIEAMNGDIKDGIVNRLWCWIKQAQPRLMPRLSHPNTTLLTVNMLNTGAVLLESQKKALANVGKIVGLGWHLNASWEIAAAGILETSLSDLS